MSFQNSLVFLTLMVFLHGVSCINMVSDYYRKYQCSHQKMAVVMRSPSLVQESHPSLLRCAFACSSRSIGDCYYAIYRPSKSSCGFIGHAQSFKPLPDYIHEEGCTVMGKIDDYNPDVCQNGGLPYNYTCVCPKGYTGRFCEINNPKCCQHGEWRLATQQDYPMLSTSQIPINMVYESEIVSLRSFDADVSTGSIRVAQKNNYFFEIDDDITELVHLKHPTEMLLTTLNDLNEVSEDAIAKFKLMSGTIIDLFPKGMIAKFYIPSVLDDERLIKNGSLGLNADVINLMSKGQRLLRRDLTRVSFNVDTNNVILGTVQTSLTISNSANFNWSWPLSYKSFKDMLNINKRSILSRAVAAPYTVDDYEEVLTPYWEIDKCWTKIQAENYDEFTSVLKEYVERGKEIRIILRGSISWDVIIIQTLQNDVAAELAPHIYPFADERSLSGDYSAMYKSVISRTNKIASCGYNLQGSTTQRDSNGDTTSVEWYVSTKPWTRIYSVSETKKVLYGNKSDLFQAALQGKTIRVCLQQFAHLTMCQSSTSLNINEEQGLIFQFSPMIVINSGKTFNGIYHTYCDLKTFIISSQGWIKMAHVNVGRSNFKFYPKSFVKTDWFVEE